MKRIIAAIIILAMATALVCGCNSSKKTSGAADDTVYEVLLSSQNAESSIHSKNVVDIWAKRIEEATNGRVKFVYYWSSSLSGIPELLDNLESGAVGAAWAGTGSYPGRFTALTGTGRPGLGLRSTAAGAEALWNWFQVEECQKELGTLVLAGAYPNGDVVINNSVREIKTASDFQGLRLRAMNSSWQAAFEELGIVPMSFGMNDTYENLEKNVADGLVQDFDFLAWSRIFEVSPFAMDQGLSVNASLLLFSPHFLNSLPDDLREIVMGCCGIELSRACGEALEKNDSQRRQEYIDGGGIVYPATPEVMSALEGSYGAARDNWIRECDQKGYDGNALNQRLLEIVAPFVGK